METKAYILSLIFFISIITGCANSPVPDSSQATKMINSLIYFGILGGPGTVLGISSTSSADKDWIVTLNDSSQYIIDKSTNIIHCIKPKNTEKATCGIYITIIDSSVIMDTNSFSCVPLGSNSMNCKPEVLDKYKTVKAQFLSRE